MEKEQSLDFSSIMLKLASPERIKEWSHGEVTRAETINYRTQRSERGGLFDERIFGPEKDYECYCGKYRRIRYKDIVCEKCGVEVTRSIVRRERMGHIELAAPVAHIWFLRGIPSRIGLLLELSIAELEKVIYFAGYIITKVNEAEKDRVLKELDKEFKSKMKTVNSDEAKDKIKESLLEVKKEINSLRAGLVLDEPTHIKYTYKYSTIFESDIGAEAVFKMFQQMDLDALILRLEDRLATTSSVDKIKLQKRLNLAKHMKRSGVRPEWMFLTVIPIIPPALRPMVALDGGRHATSDVNDLYRRVINRNNRLKKLIEINAPDVILRNEKRILQEAVDALIDNSIRHGNSAAGAMSSAQRRPLKSLADILKGKQGRFRQNLLGKRVDYSGRSVIVVGPELHLDQCGLPKHMALELFRPFVISKILEKELAYNIRGAGRLIEDAVPEVWAILEDVIKEKFVLLNRAPTLHRLGIQAFKPVLIEGNAIRLHPLVCAAFNADFDGDQMAVHVPLSDEAQAEARELMCSAKNLLRPGTGDPIVTPKLDIVLGCYWMTKSIDGEKGEGKIFPSPNAAISAYDYGQVGFRAKIKIMGGESEKYKEFGEKIFETSVGRILFNSVLPSDFRYINHEVTGKEMPALIEELIEVYGTDQVPAILDKIKSFGFKYMTMSGITWGLNDVSVPVEKPAIIKKARAAVLEIGKHFDEGLISEDERYKMIISTWRAAWEEIQKLVLGTLDINGGVRDMVISKARGSIAALSQMCGMKGLIINTSGKTLEFPVIPSYKEGLSPIEYFVTTHGARKGLTDTALNTSKAGYLTRRLVDVSQDVIVTIEDCGDKEGRTLYSKNILETTLGNAVRSRVLAKDILDKNGKVLFKKGHLITKKCAKNIEEAGSTEATVFSPLTCKSIQGICQKCYGLDLGRNHLVNLGEAVGIVAAQAIGEPGTQLTMRTFHSGGVSEASGDITMGLPRVEEIFEKRAPKNAAVVARVAGTIAEIKNDGKEKTIVLMVEGGKKSDEGSVEHPVPFTRNIIVKVGQDIKKGEIMTDGSANINELFAFGGKETAEDYILNEVSKIYSMQAAAISRKHIEVILRQMFSRKRIVESGDTEFVGGEVVENQELLRENGEVSGKKAKAEDLVLGISEVSLTTSSWLSAASFQNTSRILIDASTQGKVDELRGLKENVIIGRLIPAGTGFRKKQNYEETKWAKNNEEDEKE
jgi:DNA-directed RNA polymerase subunit beta'